MLDDLPFWLSDWPALIGLPALVLAIVSWLGDRRRWRRSDPDAVGFMPWTGLFFWSSLMACVCLGLMAREAFHG